MTLISIIVAYIAPHVALSILLLDIALHIAFIALTTVFIALSTAFEHRYIVCSDWDV